MLRCFVALTVLGIGLANGLSADKTTPAPDGAGSPTVKDIREAVTKALPLIQKGAAGHTEKRTCFACHNQGVPMLALTTARSRGLAIDEEELQKQLKFINTFLEKNRANYLKGQGQGGAVDTAGYALWTLELGGWKPNATTAPLPSICSCSTGTAITGARGPTVPRRRPAGSPQATWPCADCKLSARTSRRSESSSASILFVAGWRRRRQRTPRIGSFGCGP